MPTIRAGPHAIFQLLTVRHVMVRHLRYRCAPTGFLCGAALHATYEPVYIHTAGTGRACDRPVHGTAPLGLTNQSLQHARFWNWACGLNQLLDGDAVDSQAIRSDRQSPRANSLRVRDSRSSGGVPVHRTPGGRLETTVRLRYAHRAGALFRSATTSTRTRKGRKRSHADVQSGVLKGGSQVR